MPLDINPDPLPNPAPAVVDYQPNLKFLQEFYKTKHGDKCTVEHKLDEEGQNNYLIIFKKQTSGTKLPGFSHLIEANREINQLARIDIVEIGGKKNNLKKIILMVHILF